MDKSRNSERAKSQTTNCKIFFSFSKGKTQGMSKGGGGKNGCFRGRHDVVGFVWVCGGGVGGCKQKVAKKFENQNS